MYEVIGHGVMETRDIMEITWMETGPELEARDVMKINWSTSIEITNNTPYTRTCTHERTCRCACACTQYAHVCTYKLEFPKTIIKLSKR